MGLGPILKSAMKEAVDTFPDTLKTQSVTPMLKKAGVKDEELAFSGVGAKLDTAKSTGQQKVSRDALEAAIPGGQFGEQTNTGYDTLYDWVTTTGGASNPTYKERIITFGARGRYQSSHFPDGPDNYLMHNRVYDDYIDGKSTRVLQEIQSDLHQTGRQSGYRPSLAPDDHNTLMDLVDEGDTDGATAFARTLGWTPESGPVADWAIDAGVPKSPWEKTWLKKGIELEIADAVDKGLTQLAIPISGPQVKGLHRADGVQAWYETTVVNTAKKIAKQYGAEVEVRGFNNESKLALEIVPERAVADLRADVVSIARSLGKPLEELTEADQRTLYEKFGALHEISTTDASALASLVLRADATNEQVIDYISRSGQDQTLVMKFPGTTAAVPEELAAAARTLEERKAAGKVFTPEEKAIVDQGFDDKFDAMIAEKMTLDELKAEAKGYGYDSVAAWQRASDNAHAAARYRLKQEVTSAEGALNNLSSKHGISKDDALSSQATVIKKPDFKLYSSGAASGGAYALYMAGKEEGYTDEELMQFAESKGLSDDMRFVVQATSEGYTGKQIQDFLGGPVDVQNSERELLDPALDPKQRSAAIAGEYGVALQAITELGDESIPMEFGDALARMKVVHPNMTSVTLRTAAFFGNESAARLADDALKAQAQRITNTARDSLGLDLEWNPQLHTYFVNLPHGKFEVTPSFLESLESEGAELIGAVVGGFGGGYVGSKGGAWGTLLGSIGGAVVGSVAGTQVDYLRQAIELQTEMSADVAAHKALTAAEASVIGDVIGLGVFKGLGKSWAFADNTIQAIKDGNSKGAVQAIKEVLFVSDSEAEEIVTRLNSVLVEPMTDGANQQQIRAIATTKQSGDILIKAASQMDPLAGQAAIRSVDNRAKDLLKTAESLTDENIGRVIREDLVNYVHDTKAMYQRVKDQAAMSPYGNDFTFDFEKLALKPALEAVKRNLMSRGDSTTLERFALQAQRINGMSDSRSFADLIELRQLVNDFMFNKKITNAKDSQALYDVRDRIDAAINMGAPVVLRDQAPVWKANFEAAKLEYAKMKGVERSVLTRVLNRPGVSEKAIVQGLTKYMTAIDGTFTDVMAKLPKVTRHKAEGAVINNLTEKFTDGTGDSLRAVHFPLLDAELKKIAFTSPEARQYKAMVGEFAEIFKNDVPIANMTGQIQIPKFQSYLTADPVVRAKFEIASTVFNTIKTFVPGQTQRNMAAVRNTAKLLEQPLNSKAARDVMASFADSVDVSPAVVKLQQEAAAAAMKARDKEMVAIKLYGEGSVKAMKGKLSTYKIPMHRIATQADAKTIADQDGILMSNTESLDYALKQRGYAGILQGADKVRVLK